MLMCLGFLNVVIFGRIYIGHRFPAKCSGRSRIGSRGDNFEVRGSALRSFEVRRCAKRDGRLASPDDAS
jgi:hypothetical protein